MNSKIPRRPLGSTGEAVSIIGLGGFHIGTQADEKESIAIIRRAIDGGINFMDNCWDYNEGVSEIRMGKALRDGYRQKAFLMTKIDGRDKKTALSQIDESLSRLQTDVIDLMQFHEIIRESDPDLIFAPGGAMEAFLQAQRAGKIRHIGFTGHKSPHMMLKMLRRASECGVRFDAVQMPLSIMDAQYDSFLEKVVPGLVEQNIGIVAMKPIGHGVFLDSHTITASECLRYALGLPASVVVTGCDSMGILDQALDVGIRYSPMTEIECQQLLERTATVASKGEYELYKTNDIYDATSRNPQWLDESLRK